MLAVVLCSSLPHPPIRRVTRDAQSEPVLKHVRPSRAGMRPERLPGLIPRRGQQVRVSSVDVDVVRLVGAGGDIRELGRRFIQPGPEMGNEVLDAPVRIAEVSGGEPFVGVNRWMSAVISDQRACSRSTSAR